jgi:anti-sigma factor ChrR (cupin superfamily)
MAQANERSCPDPETLGGFLEGTLDADKRRGVAAHIETCPTCIEEIREAASFIRRRTSKDAEK